MTYVSTKSSLVAICSNRPFGGKRCSYAGQSPPQDSPSGDVKDHGGRKVKTSVKPTYPDVARQMHITGTVRLEATVAPDGKVRDTRVVGGSPMLAQEATNAVKKWKYEEAPKETVEIVEVVYQ